MNEMAVAVVPALTIPYVLLVLAVAYLANRFESKLIVIGLLTAVLAVGYGALLGEFGVRVTSADSSVSVGTPSLPGSLLRIGAVLVLAGIGFAFWTRTAAPTGTTEQTR
jgi:hypothetical protein